MKKPIRLAICSWASGIGGGAGRMESYYYQCYDKNLIDPVLISLIPREEKSPQYGESIPFIQIDQSHRFSHLRDVLVENKIDIVQFQGSFDPLVCEVVKYTNVNLLVEVLHNIECGGLFKQIDHTICVSNAVANVQGAEHQFSVILNGIDPLSFDYLENKKKRDKVVFFQVARRQKARINLDQLAPKILEFIPDAEFWLSGDGHPQSNHPNVKVFGVIEDLKKLYHQADYFVQLSDNEPFGLVVLEAMACGLPVILSNTGGFKEIVKNQEDGFLIELGEIGKVAESICDIVLGQTEESYELIRVQARKKVEQDFNIRDVVKKYQDLIIDLYEKSLNKHPPRESISEHLSYLGVPGNAVVGEALYDFHIRDFDLLAKHLTELISSISPISQIQCLKTAHELGLYLNFSRPDLMPRGYFAYLFSLGDCTPECLEMIAREPDTLFGSDLFIQYIKYLLENLNDLVDTFNLFIKNCVELGYKDNQREMLLDILKEFSDDKQISQKIKSLLESF